MMKHIILLIFILQGYSNFAQNELVKTKSIDGTILVKWFPEELVNADGFDVFRSENGGAYIKLNESPIKIDIEEIANEQDQELKNYKQMAARYVEGAQDEPLLKFYILVKSMVSDDFAKFIGIRYDDHNVIKGKNYRYKIERTANNSQLGISEEESLETDLPVAPPKETRLAFQSGSRNTFTWLPETDRYFAVNAYRRADGETTFTKINNTPIIPGQAPDEFGIIRYPDYFFEDTLVTKASYYYVFKAIDAFGDEGQGSPEIFVKSLDETPPAKVSDITLSNTDTEITIGWDKSRSNDVKGYNVYRSFNGDTTYVQRNDKLLTGTSFVDPIDRPGTYMYHIEALDEAKNSSLSELKYIIVSDLTPPPNPYDLGVNVEPGKVSLTWKGIKTDDFWGYKIMRSDKENPTKDDFQLIIPEPLKEEKYENILAGESELALYYAVAAVDTFNNESEWLISDKVMTPDTVSPQAPVIVNVTSQEESVNLQWIASPDLDVVGYQVFRCEKSDKNWVSINDDLGVDALTFSDKNPVQGEMLCYKVVAKDDAGNISPASNVFTIKSKSKDISGEQRINLSGSKYRKNKKQVELEWEEDKDFQYRGYMVFRSENDGKLSPASALLTTTTYEDKSIQENTNYQYQIKAYTVKGVVLISNIQTITIK
ncbi:fibronectin type III domain-containing protein [Portibacter lacus]|nr:hypothetical protein [Portibacter lacus]